MRLADDLLVVCRSREQARPALARLRQLLADLGLAPKKAKTRIVELMVGRRLWLSWRSSPDGALAGHPRRARCAGAGPLSGDRAMRRARDRIRRLTVRSRLRPPVKEVVKDLNGFLRAGWTTFAAGIPRGASARSSSTRVTDSRWSSANDTNAAAASAGLVSPTSRRTRAGC